MNKIVEANRKKVVSAGENICKVLTALINIGKKHHEDFLALTANGVYSTEFVKTRAQEIAANYRQSSMEYAPVLLSEIQKVSAALEALDNALDITDPEIAAALQILEASSGSMDPATEGLILNTFKGNQKALRIVRGVLVKHNKSTAAIDRYIFAFEDEVTALQDRVEAVTREPRDNWPQVQEMHNKIVSICKLIGAEFTPEQFDLGSYSEELQTNSLRKSMGLSI